MIDREERREGVVVDDPVFTVFSFSASPLLSLSLLSSVVPHLLQRLRIMGNYAT